MEKTLTVAIYKAMRTVFFLPHLIRQVFSEGLYSSIRTFLKPGSLPKTDTPLLRLLFRKNNKLQRKQKKQQLHTYKSKQNTNKVSNQSETSKKKHVPPFGNIIEPPVPLALTGSTQLPLARCHLHLLSAIAASSPPHQATSVQPWKGRQLGNDQCDKAPEFYPTYQEWEVQKFPMLGKNRFFFDVFFVYYERLRGCIVNVYIYIKYASKSISSLPRERVSKVTYVIIYDVA